MRYKIGLVWLLALILTLINLPPTLAYLAQTDNQRVDQHVSPPASPSWRGNPRLAMDDQGQAYAFWDDHRDWPVAKIYFNLWDREWGDADTERALPEADGAAIGALTVSRAGDVYLTYLDASNRPVLGWHRASQSWNTWEAPEDIRNESGHAQAGLPQDIGGDQAGSVYLVLGPDDLGQVRVLIRHSDGTWQVEVVTGEDLNFSEGVAAWLATAPDGVVWVAWGYRRADDGTNTIALRRRRTDGTWGAQQLAGSASAGYSLQGVDVAVDAAGNAYAVWSQCTGTQVCQVYLNRCASGYCNPDAKEMVATSNGDRRFYSPRVTVTSEGVAYLLYWQRNVSTGLYQLTLWQRSLGGNWSNPETLHDTYNQQAGLDLAQGGDYVGAVWSDEVGNYEYAIWSNIWRAGLLPGQWPDLAIGLQPDDVQVGQLHQAIQGNDYLYTLPLTFTVYNLGDGDVENGHLELRLGLPDQPTTFVAVQEIDVSAGYSTAVRYDWDVTDVMGRLDFLVLLDPADEIEETSELNNQASASTFADARPRLVEFRSNYKPGAFLQGVDLNNTFYVRVDWNGDLPGLGQPDFVTFDLNGSQTQVNVGDPAEFAEHTYNLGTVLAPGLNRLRLTATNGDGLASRLRTVEMIGLETPQWLASSAIPRDEPPGAHYDKAAVYHFDATWPESALDATLVADAPLMSGLFGPVLLPWSLDLEFRSDGRLGDLRGEGELLGYLAGQTLVAGDSGQIEVEGDVLLGGADSSYILQLASLSGTAQADEALGTNHLPLISSTLPFAAQIGLALQLNAQLVVTEEENGQLCWVTQTLPLQVDVEGVSSGGDETLGHVDGGVGGQPWHRLELLPGGVYTTSYAANLYAWAQNRFLVWDKTWQMTYTHALSSHPAQQFAWSVRGPTLAPLTRLQGQPASAPGALPASVYTYDYADPALAYRADDDMTLIYVRRSGIAGLNLSAYRWNGYDWVDVGLVTFGNYINAQPDVAYSGETPVILWTRVVTQVTDIGVDPRAVLPYTEIAATIYLGDQPHPPIADFYTWSTYIVGQPVYFYNQTTPGIPPETNYEWDFGDGSPHSTMKDPVHTYTSVGTYTVALTATNATGNDTVTDTVVIDCYPPTNADFGFSPLIPTVSDTVYFVGSAGGANPVPTYTWYFSDTPPVIKTGNPVTYSYSQPNTYTVWMTATNVCGQDAISHSIYVTPAKSLSWLPGVEGRSDVNWTPVDLDTPPASLVDGGPGEWRATRPQAPNDWLTMTLLTDNAVMDFMPTAQADMTGSGRVMAMWLRDPDLNYPLFVDEDTSLTVDMWAAHWDGVAWTTPTLAIPNVNTRQAPQFAYRDDRAFVVWSQDNDGDQTTYDDTAIYYAICVSPTWSAVGALLPGGDGGVGPSDLSPRIAYDRAGRATVAWMRRSPQGPDALYYAVYSNSAGWIIQATEAFETQGIDGLELVAGADGTPIALWRARSDAGMDLWYSVYDRTKDRWSAPQQLTADAQVEGGYDAIVNSTSQAVALYVARPLEYTQRTIAGESVVYPLFGVENRLFQITSPAATTRDLWVADLSVSPGNPAPGTSVHISGTLVNAGSLTVDPAYLVFRDGSDDISLLYDAGPLAAGNQKTFGFDWPVPPGDTVHTLYAVADPDDLIDEIDEINNTLSQTLVLPDLQLAWRTTRYTPDTITVTVGVENAGVIAAQAPFAVELFSGVAISLPYASATVNDDLAAGEIASVTFDLDSVDDLPAEAIISYVVIDADEQVIEFKENNNTGLVDVPLKPDLLVGPDDWVGTASRLLTVHNQGPVDASDVVVRVYRGDLDGMVALNATVSELRAGESRDVLMYGVPGHTLLAVRLDPDNAIFEGDESNNALEQVSLWPRIYLPLILRDSSP